MPLFSVQRERGPAGDVDARHEVYGIGMSDGNPRESLVVETGVDSRDNVKEMRK